MDRHKHHISLLLVLCLCAALLSPLGGMAEAPARHTTVMVYMCGADLESVNRQATRCMGEMIASKFNMDAVNVVILAGGSRFWAGRYDASKLTLLNINGRQPTVVDEFPGASMGDPDTLSFFLKLCRERYPAEHYDLVLWDHGGGPNSGVCFDNCYDSDSLSIQEMTAALGNSPFVDAPLDMLIFHACLMSSAEVAAAVAPYARYMVAGEDSIFGLSYQWLNGLENDPDVLTTARRIVDDSFEDNGKIIAAQNASERNSFAAIDLGRMQQIVGLMDAFFPKVSVSLNEANFTAMSSQRNSAVAFGVGESGPDSDYDLVDLGDLILHYRSMAQTEADALLSALNDAVYCHAEQGSGCTGLTVYHPYVNKRAMSDRLGVYETLDFSSAYREYINSFASLLTGTPFGRWDDLETSMPSAVRSTFTSFMLSLSEEQAQYLGEAEMYVVLKNGDDTYQFVSADPNIAYADGLMRGEYNGVSLHAVAQDGTLRSGPLRYVLDDSGHYLIPAEMDLRNEDGEVFTQRTLICCAYDAQTGRLNPVGVQVWEDYLNGYTTAYATVFTDYATIRIPDVARRQTVNDRGEILAYEEWETVPSDSTWEQSIDASWGFALLDDVLPRENLFVTFQLTDSQNNAYSSSLCPIDKPDKSVDIEVVYNNDALEALTLDTDNFSARMQEGVLRISGPVVYNAEEEIIVNVGNMAVNGATASDETVAVIYGGGPNWGLMAVKKESELIPDMQHFSFVVESEALSADLDHQDVSFDLNALDASTGELLGTIPVSVYLKTDTLFAPEANG